MREKRLKKSLVRCLLSAWLIISISTSATGNDDIVLRKNTAAPFDGVLISPSSYNDYVSTTLDRDLLAKKYEEMYRNQPSAFETTSYGFLGGVIFTSLLFIVIKK